MRVNTNVSQRAQQQLVLDNFGGVDFSSSPLLMASNRASYACNLINDNGVNHKRPGWEEQLKVGGQVNGIYPYDANGHKALIIYAGTTFYEAVYDETSEKYGEPSKLMSNPDWESERVQFFPQRDKVYIIGCGDYLVYGEFGESYCVKRVVDSDVYVPTTTVHGMVKGIDFNTTSSNDRLVPTEKDISGEPKILDDVNLLTRRRKNTFIGSNASDQVFYILDKRFKRDGIKKITVKYQIKQENSISGQVTINEYEEDITQKNSYLPYFYGEDEATETYTGVGFEKNVILGDSNADGERDELQSKVGMGNNNTFISGQYPDKTYANITIEYEPYYEEGEFEKKRDMITGCRFGTLFGAGGASDRLFLSGNPDYPNADFYSWFEDYTYFTAKRQTVMGSDDVPITGYVRLSDNTLATMKAGAVYEPSVYYRRAYETDAYIDEEKQIKDIGFTKWSGGTGEACVNESVVASLAEDDLFLSRNGVFGIVEVNNAATNNRYMRERSAFINGKLLNEPRLSEAVSFVYKNRYYLAVPTGADADDKRNGAVYVADPRFKSYRSDDIDGSFNYEWWYWENVPARVFANIDGQLWFGCKDGRICRFDDKFTDRTYEYSEDGCATFGNGVIVCNGEHIEQYKKCDAISFDGVVYKDNETDSDSILTGIYYVKSCESVENGYNIKICGYKSDNKEEMEKIPPINITGSVSARVRFHTIRNVCSTWYTPVFSLGVTDVLKTLMRMTISVDPVIKGEVSFGYETRDVQRLLRASVNPTLDFNNLSFEEFSFAADFATSYTVKSKVRKFNYIMFKFISDNDRDCAINNFKAIYTLTASHRGVF